MLKNYIQDHPFPHAAVRHLWPNDLLEAVLEEFLLAESQLAMWKHFSGVNEEKFEGGPHLFGKYTKHLAKAVEEKAPELAEAFDLPPLSMELVGGGYHLIRPGGLLNVHSDFSVSPNTDNYRRINLLIYLNKDWRITEHGGGLELWDDEGPSQLIVPEFNTTAIFLTSATSWHGHPVPVAGRSRRSFAAYFYSTTPPPDFTNQDTVWHPRSPRV